MTTRGSNRRRLSTLSIAFAILALLLSACQPAAQATLAPPLPPTQTVPPAPSPTAAPAGISLDPQIEIVPAVQPGGDAMWTTVMPQHQRANLQNYPVTGNALKPQIFIYPVAELPAFNEAAAKEAANLSALLQNPQSMDPMPHLPLVNAKQALHAQVKYLDFKNGKGVRYLTQFNQGPVMINNTGLVYTFQGLTGDNRYYVAAVLPVTHPELPGEARVFTDDPQQIKDYPTYTAKMIAWLDEQPAASFTPDLSSLDALIQSLEVK